MEDIMRRVLVIALLCIFIVAFIGCQSKQETEKKVAVAKVEPAPAPVPYDIVKNLSAIKTFQDYDKMKSTAWSNYDAVKAKAWNDYEKAKLAAWDKYSTFEKEELNKFRNSDRKSYLDWLDAEKTGDYVGKRRIEESSPAAKTYVGATDAKYQ